MEEFPFGEVEAIENVTELHEGYFIAVVHVEHVEVLRLLLDEVGGRVGEESEDVALQVSGRQVMSIILTVMR